MGDITPDQYEQPSEAMPVRLVRADGSAFEDLTGLIGSPGAPGVGTVNERLQAIHGRLADGSAIAKVMRGYAGARAAAAEGSRLEALANLRGLAWAAQTFAGLPGHQSRVHRQGTRAINSTTYQGLDNATGVVAGFPAQDVDFTVPAGQRLLITNFNLVLLLPNNGIRVAGRLLAGGTPRFVTSMGTGNAVHAGDTAIAPPYQVGAGTAITMDVASSANVNVWMAWDGILEPADA